MGPRGASPARRGRVAPRPRPPFGGASSASGDARQHTESIRLGLARRARCRLGRRTALRSLGRIFESPEQRRERDLGRRPGTQRLGAERRLSRARRGRCACAKRGRSAADRWRASGRREAALRGRTRHLRRRREPRAPRCDLGPPSPDLDSCQIEVTTLEAPRGTARRSPCPRWQPRSSPRARTLLRRRTRPRASLRRLLRR